MSRTTLGQFAIRLIQRTRDQAVKSDPTAMKSLTDSSTSSPSKCYSSNKFGAGSDQIQDQDQKQKVKKRAEESLRTVMYLSCWAPT